MSPGSPLPGEPPAVPPLRRGLFARRVSVAALIETGLLAALIYIVAGTAWVFTHYDSLIDFQAQWEDLVPVGELAGFIMAFLLWPVLLLLPTTCVLPWA